MFKVIALCFALLCLVGCASRPINQPITSIDERTGYRFETMHAKAEDQENLVVLAFSGGGTRAAAFSFGVLEFLRDTPVQPTVRALGLESVLRPYQLFAQTEGSVLAVVARQQSSRSAGDSPSTP